MKQSILAILMACLVSSCADVATTTPKPQVAPVKQSNQATIKSIKSARKSIKESQDSAQKEEDHLKKADEMLDKIINE